MITTFEGVASEFATEVRYEFAMPRAIRSAAGSVG